jgi:hypothetical protein
MDTFVCCKNCNLKVKNGDMSTHQGSKRCQAAAIIYKEKLREAKEKEFEEYFLKLPLEKQQEIFEREYEKFMWKQHYG